jgi:NAD(P)-dependent dehydrogenase (short-subunit alcohol dehydrogenase family)
VERLAGKVAIVTSASRGIGRACGLELAAEGAAVVVFLASDDADYITGATFMLDKGR